MFKKMEFITLRKLIFTRKSECIEIVIIKIKRIILGYNFIDRKKGYRSKLKAGICSVNR
jgi:hypothetical protein